MGHGTLRTVLPLGEDRISEAIEMVFRSFDTFVAPDYSEEGRQTFKRLITKEYLRALPERNGFSSIAEEDGRIVGLIAFRDTNHISLFFVEPERIRTGVGQTLYAAALAYVRQQFPEVSELEVNSSPYAIPAYSTFGFQVMGTSQTELGMTFVPMTAKLS